MKPAEKPKSTWLDRLLTLLGLLALLCTTLYVVFRWETIPAEVPTHFNAAGEIDAAGGKASLLVPLVIGWALYGFLSLIEAIPAVWNTGVEVTPENREAVLQIIKTMLSFLKTELALWFSYLVLCSARCCPIGILATPFFLILVFGTIIVTLVQIFRIAHKK